MDGSLPGMIYVQAEGLNAEARTLTLTLSQIQRMQQEQGVEVLLLRNGSATVSLGLSQLFTGDVPKLMELMRAWADTGTDPASYDLSFIDFSAIPKAPEFMEEELRAFQLKLRVAPAVPVGYEIRAELCLGDLSKEISLLLDDMGVTLHAQTVTDDVAIYYMNDAQESYLLESHRGSVPGVTDRVDGCEVVYQEGQAYALTLDRSVAEGEFDGLCAFTSEAGTYYLGVLPS